MLKLLFAPRLVRGAEALPGRSNSEAPKPPMAKNPPVQTLQSQKSPQRMSLTEEIKRPAPKVPDNSQPVAAVQKAPARPATPTVAQVYASPAASASSAVTSPAPPSAKKALASAASAVAMSSANKPPASPSPAPPQNKGETTIGDKPPVRGTWEAFVNSVKASNGFLGALLEHTSLYKEDTNELTLGLPKKMGFLLDKLQDPKNIERTEKFLQNLWGDSRKIVVELLGQKEEVENLSPKQKAEKQKNDKQQKEKLSVESHPLVQATQKIFTGKNTKIVDSTSGRLT